MNRFLLDDGIAYVPLFKGEPFPYYYRYEGYMIHSITHKPSKVRPGYGLVMLTYYRNGGITKGHSIGAYPLSLKKIITTILLEKTLKLGWHDLQKANLPELATLELIKGN